MIQTKKSIERISVWFVTGNLPPYFSGAGRNDLLLAPYCVKYGLNVTLVTELHKGDKRESIIDGVSVKRIRMGTDHSLIWRILGPFNMLKSLITGPKPDIVRFGGFSF